MRQLIEDPKRLKRLKRLKRPNNLQGDESELGSSIFYPYRYSPYFCRYARYSRYSHRNRWGLHPDDSVKKETFDRPVRWIDSIYNLVSSGMFTLESFVLPSRGQNPIMAEAEGSRDDFVALGLILLFAAACTVFSHKISAATYKKLRAPVSAIRNTFRIHRSVSFDLFGVSPDVYLDMDIGAIFLAAFYAWFKYCQVLADEEDEKNKEKKSHASNVKEEEDSESKETSSCLSSLKKEWIKLCIKIGHCEGISDFIAFLGGAYNMCALLNVLKVILSLDLSSLAAQIICLAFIGLFAAANLLVHRAEKAEKAGKTVDYYWKLIKIVFDGAKTVVAPANIPILICTLAGVSMPPLVWIPIVLLGFYFGWRLYKEHQAQKALSADSVEDAAVVEDDKLDVSLSSDSAGSKAEPDTRKDSDTEGGIKYTP